MTLINSHPSMRSQRLTEKRNFLFVDVQADTSQHSGVGREKKVFCSKNSHRKRRAAALASLKAQIYSIRKTPQDGGRIEEAHITTHESAESVIHRAMWSLISYMSQGYVDPFSTYAIPMTESMNMYFYHFREHTVTSAYPLDVIRMSGWWWQQAVASPALLQTLLFLSAGHKAALESEKGVCIQTQQKCMEDSIRLRIMAINNLNSLLGNPATAMAESTILLVGAIITIEALDANHEAVKAHMSGVKKLVDLAGGLESLNHMTLHKLYYSDTYCAALGNTLPTFPMLPRFRSEILQEAKMFRGESYDYNHTSKLSHLEPLGSGFSSAPWYPEINPSLKYFIEVFRRLVRHFELARNSPSQVMPTDNDLFLVFQYELLAARFAVETESADLNEPLRLAILIYSYTRISHYQQFPMLGCMADTLRASLVPRLAHLTTTAPQLLFWVLVIGGMASQQSSSHSWFVKNVADVAWALEVTDWTGQVRPLLGRFFYTDQPGQTGAEDLWSEVLALAGSYRYIAPKCHSTGVSGY